MASYLIPLVAGMGVYGFAWSVGIGGFSTEAISEGLPDSIPLAIGLIGTLGFLQTAIPSPGEEIGWRGLLVPELARITSYAKVSLITAAIWSIYHYPMLIFGPTPNRWTVKCLCFLSSPKSLWSQKLPLRRRRRGVAACPAR